MSNFHPSSPSAVPCIRIHDTDSNAAAESALFEVDGCEMFFPDMSLYLQGSVPYACSQGLQSDFLDPLNPIPELEDMPELSHFPNQPPLTGSGYSLPYPTIMRENMCTDRGLSPASLGSPVPSPSSSFGSSLSPSSIYDALPLSDTEPDTPEAQFLRGLNYQSNGSLAPHPPFFPGEEFPPLHSDVGPRRPRAPSLPRQGPVASKAMLEANGRRRRHPAQFRCDECDQTFTAQFSLKRHMQSHTGLRPFQCSITGCSQRFYNSSDCKRHERSKKRHKDL